MFLKLTKHELQESGRIMLPLSGLILLLGGLSNLSLRYIVSAGSRTFFLTTLFGLELVAFGLGCFAICVMALVMMIERFRRTVLTDRGYLTNTLPVTVHGIIWSRWLSALLYSVLTAVVVFLSVSIMFLGVADMHNAFTDFFMTLQELLREMFGGNEPVIWFALKSIVMLILSFAATCFHFYAAMAIGHSFANHKGLLSVVFFFAIRFVIRLFSTCLLAATRFFGVMNAASSFLALFYAADKYLLGTILSELVLAAALYITTWLMLKKHLNLA